MKIALFGYRGKVGSVLRPALERAGHDVRGIGSHDAPDFDGVDSAIDFTRPDAVEANVRGSLEAGVPCIVGTTGLEEGRLRALADLAEQRAVSLFVAPNFAVGAVLMMRFATEAAVLLRRAEIVELHHEGKRDAPSGTAKATAERLGGDVPIHSVRLPGLVAHQEVLLAGEGQLLTIRHDTLSREAFVPGVLLALERLHALPAGITVGLDSLL